MTPRPRGDAGTANDQRTAKTAFPNAAFAAGKNSVPASKLPANIEGGSIAGLLANGEGEVKRSRREMVFHFPHYQSGDGPHSALFLEHYKLIKFYENKRLALFDVSKDISEQNDLAAQMPEKTAELDRLLMRYLNDIDAQMAVTNPRYDPNLAPTARQRGGGNNRTDAVLSLIDVNGDGQLSATELRAIPGALRERDADGDGAVTIQEIQSVQQIQSVQLGRNRRPATAGYLQSAGDGGRGWVVVLLPSRPIGSTSFLVELPRVDARCSPLARVQLNVHFLATTYTPREHGPCVLPSLESVSS